MAKKKTVLADNKAIKAREAKTLKMKKTINTGPGGKWSSKSKKK